MVVGCRKASRSRQLLKIRLMPCRAAEAVEATSARSATEREKMNQLSTDNDTTTKGSEFSNFADPDPYPEYGSGYTHKGKKLD